ncbi:hypothetical protein B0H14DRAFT_2655209 [Mycena olivaceomarginata]|nr:hypothetical protein B0H14DRAFT_2655209 [Mycena olivaceomarginata]
MSTQVTQVNSSRLGLDSEVDWSRAHDSTRLGLSRLHQVDLAGRSRKMLPNNCRPSLRWERGGVARLGGSLQGVDEDEKEELKDLEESYKDEKKATQKGNQEQKKKKGCRKAVLKPLPQTSKRLNELRARGADLTKIKQWYWNQRTKDKGRKIEPFRAWLSRLTVQQGHPRRLRMAWVLWRDPKHGDVLRRRYRTKYGKDADEETEEDGGTGDLLHHKLRLAVAYLDELMDEEKSHLTECREKDFEEHMIAYERALKGETDCTADELDERRRHAEVISARTLKALCAQMKCKGLLILGEIMDSDEEEIFISMVQSGSLAKHPGIDFTKWAPMRSKAMLQTFAVFLVASKKDEKGDLHNLSDPGPLGTAAPSAPSLCPGCLGSLTRLESRPLPGAEPGVAPRNVSVGKKKGKGKGKEKGKGKRNVKRGEEEEEALESGADEEEEWQGCDEEGEEEQQQGYREAEGVDELESSACATPAPEEVDELESSVRATPAPEEADELESSAPVPEEMDELESSARATPAPEDEPHYLANLQRTPTSPMKRWLSDLSPGQRAFKIWDWNTINDYEYEIEKNKARNRDLLTALGLEQATVRAMGTQSADQAPEPAPPRPKPHPAYRNCPDQPLRGSRQFSAPSVAANDEDLPATAVDEDDKPIAPVNDASGPAVPANNAGGSVVPAVPADDAMPPPPHDVVPAENSTPASHSTSPTNKADGIPTPTPISEKARGGAVAFQVTGGVADMVNGSRGGVACPRGGDWLPITGKALLTHGCPPAVQWWIARARKASQIPAGIGGNDDEREDFYANVISWWLALNPGWRKEGIVMEEDWVAHGLKQEDSGDLGDLPAGLNGLTSMMACLWWWVPHRWHRWRLARVEEVAGRHAVGPDGEDAHRFWQAHGARLVGGAPV